MKKIFTLMAIGLLLTGTSAFANFVTYEFSISGTDLMSYVTVDGADGSTAVENNIYSGARLLRNYSNAGWGDFDRSYHASSNDAFSNWADNSGDRLVDFNLWGYDGNGANWGEVYKVYDWQNSPSSSSTNWNGYTKDWPSTWGSFDDYANSKPNYGDHYNDGQLLGWEADTYSSGLGFGTGQAEPSFTFQLTLNMDDPAFYGNTIPWYEGQVGQMVFWFGGWTLNSTNEWTGLYEGNIVLQGKQIAPVPEPATLLLLGSGLAGLAFYRRKRK